MSDFWLWKVAELLIQRCGHGFILLETICFSHGQFGFVVEALHYAFRTCITSLAETSLAC